MIEILAIVQKDVLHQECQHCKNSGEVGVGGEGSGGGQAKVKIVEGVVVLLSINLPKH